MQCALAIREANAQCDKLHLAEIISTVLKAKARPLTSFQLITHACMYRNAAPITDSGVP